MNLKILYEDNHLVAVYKPAGILVQANVIGVENLLDIIKKFIKERDNKPGNVFLGLVHRLDRPVAGIVVFAKTSKSASRLSEQFREREVGKIYTALVEGETEDRGQLIHFIKKDTEKIVAVVGNEGDEGYQECRLEYERIKTNKKYSLLKINLLTGRFNQIRVQLAHIGHPIVGDTKYGGKNSDVFGLCATEIKFKKATSDEEVELKVDYPKEWDNLLSNSQCN